MPTDNLVLVVDDNQDLVETTCLLLQILGINARPCLSGTEAILLSGNLRPNVVVLDIGMPAPDGFATFSLIRELKGCSTVPIIAVTAYSDVENSQRIKDMGFATHFVKPAKIELLAATVKRLAEVEARKAWGGLGRNDALTAQRLEVALIYKTMLGNNEARKYLESVNISILLIDRILNSTDHRI